MTHENDREHFRQNARKMWSWLAEDLTDLEYDVARAEEKLTELRGLYAEKQAEIDEFERIVAKQEADGWK